MGSINMRGVLVGGLAAGLLMNVSEFILNVPVLGATMEEQLSARNLPAVGGGAITYFVVMTFILGWFLVWLYAAMRPRLGPGPKTAICAGLTVWFLTYFNAGVAMSVMGFFSTGTTIIALVWGLVELVLAGLVGGRLYTEPA